MKKVKYIINGKSFADFEAAEAYAKENGWRITNTETLRKGVCLLTVTSA